KGDDGVGDRGDGGRRHHDAGHLRVRAAWTGRARAHPGAVPCDRHPAALRGADEGVRHRPPRGAVRGCRCARRRRGSMVETPTRTWIFAGLVFVAVALGFVSLALAWEWVRELSRRRAVRRQLEWTLKSGAGAQDALFRGQPA